MPTSATGRSTIDARAAHGFTLLELLVVLTIVGVLVSMARLAVPDSARGRIERTAHALAATVDACRRGAVLSGAPGGVRVLADAYQALVYRGKWSPDGAPAALADGLELRGGATALGTDDETPTVLCLPTGELHLPPLHVTHLGRDGHFVIDDDIDGEVVATWVDPSS
ncbi:MAG: prepilin-type N-terminal cleavage/methylation domain-containing protein [Gammaproteobacteria bacterium]